MPAIDLSILNQRQTPAFYADVFANRPAAGFVGRIFVSTNTFAFYRDNGTGWDLIGGPGTGTVTGSGAAGQVAFWSGSSLISGENNLWWDSVNNHFGINTNTPGTALDVHHDQSTVLQLNQTTATNDTRIAFQNAGSSKWRIGNFYSAGSNDYKVNDAVLNINRFTIKSSSGQTFVGDETTSSGLFVVNSSSGDAHIVALGATAPSIRVRNAGVGASLQFGLGLATTTNNFIQGATGGEFCIFNDSLTAQPILFGIKDAGLGNTQEAARISPARNFLIGTTTDAGQKLQVSGSGFLSGSLTTSGITCNGNLGIGLSNPDVIGYGTGNILGILGAAGNPSNIQMGIVGTAGATNTPIGDLNYFGFNGGTSVVARTIIRGSLDGAINSTKFDFFTMASGVTSSKMTLTSAGNVGIGTTAPQTKLHIAETSSSILFTEGSGIASIIGANAAGTSSQELFIKGFPLSFTGNGGGGSTQLRLAATGNLLIGTTTDAGDKLQVQGGIVSYGTTASGIFFQDRSGSAITGFYTTTGLNVYTSASGIVGIFNLTTGVYTPTSDKNKKKNFEQSNFGLDAVLKLKPTLYNMINQNNNEAKELGFIAQEVKEVIEQAYVENGEFIGINYQPIVATLVKAIQELNQKIENLK